VNSVSNLELAQPRTAVWSRLRTRGAYQWYAGTIFGLAYQSIEIVNVWTNGRPLVNEIVGTVLLGVFYVGYVVAPPLLWMYRVRVRVSVITIYWLATLVLWPFIGVDVIWIWPLVGAIIAFCWMPIAPSFILSGLILVGQLIAAWAVGWADGIVFAPFVTLTVLISLFGITRQIMANQQLRAAQATIATLAAAEERARLARDLHDVLGHSLTVVAVKSELAGRLVDLDPARAVQEIGDIETLARTALADLRAAVTSYREMNLDAELSAARTALTAADITAHIPGDSGVVAEELRALFGWVVREGVTNVIRHSDARQCWIEIEQHRVSVRDDGAGGAMLARRAAAGDETRDAPNGGNSNSSGGGNGSSGKASGNGLHGLRERAREAGAELTASAGDRGGFTLTVQKGVG
jgi:two-component system sensor histidine kinase DesK